MLVLRRKANEAILIDGNIKIIILKVDGQYVKIGIEAPDEVDIVREELIPDHLKEELNAVYQDASPVS